MVKFSRDELIDYGPDVWEISTGPEGECCVDPRSRRSLIIFATIVVIITLSLALWLLFWPPFQTRPKDDLGMRVAIVYVGVMASIGVIAILVGLNYVQQRQGPFLVLSKERILLRNDQRIEFENFESFGIFRKLQDTGEGKTQVTYLTVKCKDGEEIEVLRSEYRKEVLSLKQSLEEWLEEKGSKV